MGTLCPNSKGFNGTIRLNESNGSVGTNGSVGCAINMMGVIDPMSPLGPMNLVELGPIYSMNPGVRWVQWVKGPGSNSE